MIKNPVERGRFHRQLLHLLLSGSSILVNSLSRLILSRRSLIHHHKSVPDVVIKPTNKGESVVNINIERPQPIERQFAIILIESSVVCYFYFSLVLCELIRVNRTSAKVPEVIGFIVLMGL